MSYRGIIGFLLLGLLAAGGGVAAQEEDAALTTPTVAPEEPGPNAELVPTDEDESVEEIVEPPPSTGPERTTESFLDKEQERAEETKRFDERIEALKRRADSAQPKSQEMMALYVEVGQELRQKLDQLEIELERLADPFDTEVAPGGGAAQGAKRRFRMGDDADRSSSEPAPEALASEARRLRRLQEDGRWSAVQREGHWAGALLDLRNELLPLLPDERREEIFSLSPLGRRVLRFEWEILLLWERAFQARRMQLLSRTSTIWDDLRGAGQGVRLFVRTGIALLLWLIVRRRVRALARTAEGDRAPTVTQRIASTVRPGFLVLLATYGIDWALEGLDSFPVAHQLILVSYLYGGYRIVADSVATLIVRIAVWNRFPLGEHQHSRLIAQVRWVVRLATVVLVVASLVSLRVGPGVLRSHTLTVGWWLAALLTLVFVVSWRHELAESYLAVAPGGVLAPRVRRWTGRSMQAFYAPLTAGALAVDGLVAMVRDAAMRSEETKRLTAYILRRKVEQQAREQGYSEGDLSLLPSAVVDAFDPTITGRDLQCLGALARTDEGRESVAAWSAGRGASVVMLTGEAGVGRTAWLSRIEGAELPVVRLPLGERALDGESLRRRLGAALLEAGGTDGSPPLEDALRGENRRIFVIPDAERLFLSDVNGFHAVVAMSELVEETAETIFWVLSMESFAYQHLRASQSQMAALPRIEIPSWSDDQICLLLRLRNGLQDVPITFRDLAMTIDPVAAADEVRSVAAYARLLWDSTGGNPSDALHFFLRSLVLNEDGGLTVRFFRQPDGDEIAEMGDDALFVLAAIVRHRALTPQEAVRVTCLPPGICAPLLARLARHGVLATEAGSYRLVPHWRATAVRLLRRRNMLPA